jgi:hypothetical protein
MMSLQTKLKSRGTQIAIALVVLALIISCVFFLLRNKGVDPNTKVVAQPSPTSDGKTVWNEKGSFTYDKNQPEEVLKQEDVQVVSATSLFGGTVDSYTDMSTYAELAIHIGGDVDRLKKFKLSPTGIVFDAVKNTVVLPSTIAHGNSVRVIATGSSQTNDEAVSVVILNDNPKLLFSPIDTVESTETDILLTNNKDRVKYSLPKTALSKNALSNLVFEKEKFKSGDRVFFYVSETQPKQSTSSPEVSASKNGVLETTAPVTTTAPKLDTSNFKLITVSEAYIYPSAK